MREIWSSFLIISRPGKINEDTAHESRTNGIEMGPILPINSIGIHQPKIDFVNKSCSLKGMAGLLCGHVTPGQAVEFFVDEGHEPLESTLVTGFPCL